MMKVLSFVLSCLLIIAFASAVEEKVQSGHHDHHDPLSGEKMVDGERNVHRDHEAVLGSRKEAEEADDLSPEQAKELLEKLAKTHDLDGDQHISREEFITWILKSFKSLDEEEATERMKEEDTDKDGKLMWEEYFKQQYDYSVEEFEKMKAEPEKEDHQSVLEMVEEDKLRFDTADLDKDGSLDQSEYIAFYHPYDYEHMHALEIARNIRDFDHDKNGVVSMSEYIGDITDKESIETEKTTFAEYDTNKDEVLSGDELKKWLIQDNMESAKEEVDHLMEIADIDKSGHLSFDEIKDHHEEFVSSQATDYGSTLQRMRDEL